MNEAIRGLWPRAGGTLNAVQRVEYERLLEEWEAALRAEVAEAA